MDQSDCLGAMTELSLVARSEIVDESNKLLYLLFLRDGLRFLPAFVLKYPFASAGYLLGIVDLSPCYILLQS